MSERAVLWGSDHHELGRVEVAGVGADTAIAITKGARPKTYAHTDPNEDAVAAFETSDGVLLVLADGHNGFLSARESVTEVLDQTEVLLAREDPVEQIADVFHRADQRVFGRGRQSTTPESRTTLVLAMIRADRLQWAAMGDSAVLVGSAHTGVGRLDDPRRRYIGWGMTPEEVRERIGRGERTVERSDWIVLASDGYSDFVANPAEAAAAAMAAAGTPGDLARALVEAAFEGGAADNVAVAVARVRSPRGTI